MKIAIIIEGSSKNRSIDVENVVKSLGHECYNLGMKNVEGEPDLTYIETGFLTALLLNMKAVDFVVGGCGTGQGYMNMVLQFPGVSCGMLLDPVDAFLYSQVNAGNCIALALNKGYGNLAGDINLKFMLEKLFGDYFGKGYPPARVEIQQNARKRLAKISEDNHKTMPEIINGLDPAIIKSTFGFPGVLDFIKTSAPDSELKKLILSIV